MKRAIAAILLTLMIPVSAQAGFPDLVRTIERSTGVRRTTIPFFGVARFFIRMVEPEGISDFKLAVFEGSSRSIPSDFDASIRSALERDWQPIVRVVQKKDRERVLIYARPSRRGMRMLIVAHQPAEAVVMEVEVDPKRFSRLIQRAQKGHPMFHGR
jgi:hypothetical protein